ncbi:MAG: flagellar hook-basal body complex protein [Pseudomonadota bacterium]
MDNASYVHLTRQTGLLREMDIISTNLANISTHGYRREGAVFSEFVEHTEDALGSLSMTAARTRFADDEPGPLKQTGSQLDFAIEGPGFFQVQTPNGVRLTRAGAFALTAEGQLTTFQGHAVLSQGGAPVQVPPTTAVVSVSPDGVVSADGGVVGEIGLVAVQNPNALRRDGATMFEATEGVVPSETSRIAQGFLESSNVVAVEELSRMIEVQRAYELGQSMLTRDDDLVRNVIRTLGEPTG